MLCNCIRCTPSPPACSAMAAFKAISRRVPGCRQEIHRSPMIKHLPHQLISSRWIASRLFVGGLSIFSTEEVLAEAFSKYGKVIEAQIVSSKITGRPKGFGFVTFASEEEAMNALAGMCGTELSGKVIFVDYAKATQQPSSGAPIARGPPELPPSKD